MEILHTYTFLILVAIRTTSVFVFDTSGKPTYVYHFDSSGNWTYVNHIYFSGSQTYFYLFDFCGNPTCVCLPFCLKWKSDVHLVFFPLVEIWLTSTFLTLVEIRPTSSFLILVENRTTSVFLFDSGGNPTYVYLFDCRGNLTSVYVFCSNRKSELSLFYFLYLVKIRPKSTVFTLVKIWPMSVYLFDSSGNWTYVYLFDFSGNCNYVNLFFYPSVNHTYNYNSLLNYKHKLYRFLILAHIEPMCSFLILM